MTTHPEFNEKTTALTVAAAFPERIKNKIVLITGVSPKGIGGATAHAIASQSPSLLLLASRTPTNLAAVKEAIHAAYPLVDVGVIPLDLSSQASVRECAHHVKSLTTKLDLLINNAGVTGMARFRTAEDIEGQFGTNHIGPFLLTALLMPLLEAAAKGEGVRKGETRIVNVASGGHRLSPIRFHDIDVEKGNEVPEGERFRDGLPEVYLRKGEKGYLPVIAYGQSKTANILFTLSLQQVVPKKGISSYCLHPGGVKSELGRGWDEETNAAIEKTSKYWKGIDEGASTTMVAALDPALDEQCGLYLENCQFADVAPFAKDPVAAEKLWTLSEKLVGEKFKI